MIGIVSRSLVLLLTLLRFALPAQAQLSQTNPLQPPSFQLIDRNGVDIVSGVFNTSIPVISIGVPGNSLDYQISTQSGYLLVNDLSTSDNWSMFVYTNDYCPVNGQYPPTSAYWCTVVRLPGKFVRFANYNGGLGWQRLYSAGFGGIGGGSDILAPINGGWMLTDKDGVRYTFTKAVGSAYYATRIGPAYYATRIDYPDGRWTTLNYSTANGQTRKQSIVSSTGLMLKFDYTLPISAAHSSTDSAALSPAGVTAVNIAIDACSATADICAYTKTWPRATLTRITTPPGIAILRPNGSTITITTDNYFEPISIVKSGSTFLIQRTNTVSSIGSENISQTSGPQINGVTQISDGGQTWNYTTTRQDYGIGYTLGITDARQKTTMSRTDPSGNVSLASCTAYFNYNTCPSIAFSELPWTNYVSDNHYLPSGGYRVGGGGIALNRDTRDNILSVALVSVNKIDGLGEAASYDSICGNPVTCNKPHWTQDALGNETDFAYDSVTGLITQVLKPADVDGVRPRTDYFYTRLNAYTSNGAGGYVPSGPISVLASTSTCLGGAACAGTASEMKTSQTYGLANTANNLFPLTNTIAAGDGGVAATSTTTYDMIGNAIVIDGPLPGTADTTVLRYDASRLLVGEVGPVPNGSGAVPTATRNTYNADEKLILTEKGTVPDQTDAGWSQFVALENTAIAYNAMNLPTLSVETGGGQTLRVTATDYNGLGLASCITQRMNTAAFPTVGANGVIAGGSLPSSACTLGTQGGSGPDRLETRSYDGRWRLTQIRRAVGTSNEIAYATYTYATNDKVASTIDANGNQAKYTYDGYDRLSQWFFPAPSAPTGFNPASALTAIATAGTASTTDYEQYSYDNDSRRTSLRHRDGRTLTYTYDALNRVVLKTVPPSCAPIQVGACTPSSATRSVYYGYDLQGHQRYARFDSATGDGITDIYDALGRLTSSTLAMAGTSRALSHTYDAAGNRLRITHPDGVYFDQNYDARSQLYQTFSSAPSRYNPALQSQLDLMLYDGLGRRKSRMEGGQTYSYDGVSRLRSFSTLNWATGSWTFGYNPASQIVSGQRTNDSYVWTGGVTVTRPYAVNGLNQYTSVGGQSYDYDANGNLISDGTTNYAYDAENRLIGAAGRVNANLVYDPLGRLWQTSGGTAGTTQFLHDGDAIVAEYDGANTLLRRYVYGAGPDEVLVAYEGAAIDPFSEHFLTADHQGSIITIANRAGAPTSTPLKINTYDEHGFPGPSNAGVSSSGRFAYTGQAWIPELGMYYYKARIYSPVLGRFLQTDPIGYKDQINLYEYVGDDPVDGRDSSGMQPVEAEPEIRPEEEPRLVEEPIEPAAGIGHNGGPDIRDSFGPQLTITLPGGLRPSPLALGLPQQFFDSIHGNSRSSMRDQHRYEIYDPKTGDVKKTGISGGKLNQNDTSGRANRQANAINKAGGRVSPRVVEHGIKGRAAALKAERAATNRLNDAGHSLELQHRPGPE